MFTIFFTTAAILSSMTTKAQPAKKIEATVEARPDYMQRVDQLVNEIFTESKIEEYKRLGLM